MKYLLEGDPSLAGLLGMSNGNLDQILSLSALGRMQKGGGFVLLLDRFKYFLVVLATEPYYEHTVFKI